MNNNYKIVSHVMDAAAFKFFHHQVGKMLQCCIALLITATLENNIICF